MTSDVQRRVALRASESCDAEISAEGTADQGVRFLDLGRRLIEFPYLWVRTRLLLARRRPTVRFD